MSVKAQRVTPIPETGPKYAPRGICPKPDELRSFLLEISKERFGPLDIHDCVLSYNLYDTLRPYGWLKSSATCVRYGYIGTPKTAWPILVHDLTGMRVATTRETLRAARYCTEQLDAPLNADKQRRYDLPGPGLPVSLEWRDVYEWDWRRKTYAPVAKMSVWSVR